MCAARCEFHGGARGRRRDRDDWRDSRISGTRGNGDSPLFGVRAAERVLFRQRCSEIGKRRGGGRRASLHAFALLFVQRYIRFRAEQRTSVCRRRKSRFPTRPVVAGVIPNAARHDVRERPLHGERYRRRRVKSFPPRAARRDGANRAAHRALQALVLRRNKPLERPDFVRHVAVCQALIKIERPWRRRALTPDRRRVPRVVDTNAHPPSPCLFFNLRQPRRDVPRAHPPHGNLYHFKVRVPALRA